MYFQLNNIMNRYFSTKKMESNTGSSVRCTIENMDTNQPTVSGVVETVRSLPPSVNATSTILSKPIPLRPVGLGSSRVVVIQSPNLKASEFTQGSNGQIMLSALTQKSATANKSIPLTNSIIIPSSNASLISGKSQIMLQTPKNIVPVTVSTSTGNKQQYAYLSTIMKPVTAVNRKTNENQILTHLSVVPAPTNQKIVFKSIKPKVQTSTVRRLSAEAINPLNTPKPVTQQTIPTTINSNNLFLPISTATRSPIIKPKPLSSVINLKITNGQIQSENKSGITVLRENSFPTMASSQQQVPQPPRPHQPPPLQLLTKPMPSMPAPTITTSCVKIPTPTEKEIPPIITAEKEYTLSIPEGNTNFLDADSSIELSIKENSTDTVEVTCTISNSKEKPKNGSSSGNGDKNRSDLTIEKNNNTAANEPSSTPKKIHEVAILKKPRLSLQDTDWKKSRTDFVSILDRDKEKKPDEIDTVKIVPLNLEMKKKEKEPDIQEAVIENKLPEITKTIVTERRRKSHNTILKDDDEIEFTSSMSPEYDDQGPPKFKPHLDTTFKKLSMRKELATKSKLAVDDIQIELIKKEEPPSELTSEEDFDLIKALEWEDGIGKLPGSDLKFHINEFGFVQMVTDSDIERIKSSSTAINKMENNGCEFTKPIKKLDSEIVLYCIACGCYGCRSEFMSSMFCSTSCSERYSKETDAKNKKKGDKKPVNLSKKKSSNEFETTSANIKTEVGSSNGTPAQSDDDNTSNDTTQGRTYPWLTGKKGFSWAKYLTHINGKSAPIKLFKEPFPYTKNGFKVGMKLEGIDPQHPSHYCVLTVAEVLGYRLRLHFDGYPDKHDFWVNADSLNIFPIGWCDKNNHKLYPPKGHSQDVFNWTTYLKQCKAQPAPRGLFLNRPENSPCPNGFRLGMKLEAVDRKNSSLVCVATVSDIMDNRILVHFDSWDDIYDYWADPSSPYIHPVGWCESKGHSLTPPNSFKDPETFTWETYLKETKSQAAPARAFKQRPPKEFKRGMRIECVDKRVPRFIRVATVDDVRDHQIRVSFDGWPDKYSYWVDDDSPDIHPAGWCQKSGHPIQPPLTPEDIYSSECTTPGCRGWGNALGPHLEVHHIAAACPYSDENYDKELISDRLLGDLKPEKPDEAVPLSKEPKRHAADSTTASSTIKENKYTKRKNYNCDSDDEWSSIRGAMNVGNIDKSKPSKKRKRTQSQDQDDDNHPSLNNFVSKLMVRPDADLLKSVTQDNYDPTLIPDPNKITPFRWEKHSKNIAPYVNNVKDPRTWTEHDVVEFISTIPSCKDLSIVFSKHQIDGEALLMLSQHDLTSILGFKLGPAIKLYNSIVLLRQNVLMCC
ncbi:lethal(3)malignant brain tumor-like protein 3 isoform X2 [Chrysoperla carnea]|uniref:lethal(3)malignant brain tumor-like protein 3 isoform X2 n=1 Tax=Chrysoperla carnea TaxID=189513 RepID=UPI001D05F0DB|nr:lethal(3)malignant brain tumor-like protein 3 isoform X2 [Chrysoperla carnea]